MIAYQHLKPGTQIFGHLISEFDSFILIWQIKNKIRSTYPFFSEKTMGNKIFLYGAQKWGKVVKKRRKVAKSGGKVGKNWEKVRKSGENGKQWDKMAKSGEK